MKQEPLEVVYSAQKRTVCNGGGALGHPAVYYTIGEEGFVDCGYCGRRFVLQSDSSAH